MRFVLFLLLLCIGWADDVTTAQYGNARIGSNSAETILTPSNVGMLMRVGVYTVDGSILTQPLYLSGVSVGGKATNVVIVGTMAGSLYAFNADEPGGAPIWKVNVSPAPTNINVSGLYVGTPKTVGFFPTPVIDPVSSSLYALGSDSIGIWHLYCLDVATGNTKIAAVSISGEYPGTGFTNDVIVGGKIQFLPLKHWSRAALTLSNGKVYVCFANYGNDNWLPYHGWVFAYDATTLSQIGVWNTTPSGASGNGSGAGIWQSGGGPAADGSGNIYLSTGNGDWNGVDQYGESLMKLSPTLTVLDWMTPAAWATMNSNDWDFSSSYTMLIGSFVVAGSKDGNIWVLNQSALGNLQGGGGNPPIVQTWNACGTPSGFGFLWGGMAFMNNTLYVSCSGVGVSAFSFNGSVFNTTPVATFTANHANLSSAMSGSANGAGQGILWVSASTNTSTTNTLLTEATSGIIMALDATTLSLLWSSTQHASRDLIGIWAKYTSPTVVNGKVYAPSLDGNGLAVYGLPKVVSGQVTITGKVKVQ